MQRIKFLLAFASLLLLSLLAVEGHAAPTQGIAVWDLEDFSPGGSGNFGDILTAQLCECIAKSRSYTLVERSKLQRILEEQKIGSSELADSDYALRLGGMLGARLMVFGSYMIIGQDIRVDIRLVDVETGQVLKSVGKKASPPDLNAGMEAIKAITGELAVFLDAGTVGSAAKGGN